MELENYLFCIIATKSMIETKALTLTVERGGGGRLERQKDRPGHWGTATISSYGLIKNMLAMK